MEDLGAEYSVFKEIVVLLSVVSVLIASFLTMTARDATTIRARLALFVVLRV